MGISFHITMKRLVAKHLTYDLVDPWLFLTGWWGGTSHGFGRAFKKEEKGTFEPKILRIQIESKLQSKVIEAICNLLGLHFEQIIPTKKDTKPKKEKEIIYDPEFIEKMKRGDEDIKKGRVYKVAIDDIDKLDLWEKNEKWK